MSPHKKPNPDILKGYDISVIEAVENERTVLRIILPDRENRSGPGMSEPFAKQLTAVV